MITIAMPSSRCRRSSRARICACTVTSSAVVGSSAISSLGSLASAMAIIARWRMPPENSCGYSSTRRLGSGMPTSPSSSIARSRAAALDDILVRAHRLDQLGADLVEGMQRGQRVLEDHRDVVAADPAQIAFAERNEVSALEQDPSRRSCALVPRVSPSVVSEETDLPEPDSPTMPSVRPACDLVGDAVDRVHDAVFGGELDVQVLTRSSGSAALTSTSPAGRGRRRRCRRRCWRR